MGLIVSVSWLWNSCWSSDAPAPVDLVIVDHRSESLAVVTSFSKCRRQLLGGLRGGVLRHVDPDRYHDADDDAQDQERRRWTGRQSGGGPADEPGGVAGQVTQGPEDVEATVFPGVQGSLSCRLRSGHLGGGRLGGEARCPGPPRWSG